MFLERLSSEGIDDTSVYYKPSGKFNTAMRDSDVQMPNCTQYCYLRSFSATSAKSPYPIARNSLGFGNAKTWYELSPLPKGQELKNGSIACFDGKYGHVAFVERVIDKTHALISESQYDEDKSLRNNKFWQKRVVELVVGKATLIGVGALQGFIYLPINDIRTNRDTSKEQISINEEMVNLRTSPNGDVFCKGCYIPTGTYDVLNIQNDDEFNWYQIDKKGWVREGDWVTYYPAMNDEITKIKIENEILKQRLKEINNLSEVS